MAGELLQKIKQLKKLVVERNNKEFKKNAVEQLVPDKVDEDILPAVDNVAPVEEPTGEEHVEGEHAEKNFELETMEVEAMLRKSIAEEEEAIASYIKRARTALKNDFHGLYELFKDLAGEEMVHVAELRTTLKLFGLEDKLKELKGKLEVHSMFGVPVTEAKDEHVEKMRQLRELADKERKNFDFVGEYMRDKTEYDREKVVGAINDLIAGKSDLASAVDKIVKDGKKVAKDAHKEEPKKSEKPKKDDKKEEADDKKSPKKENKPNDKNK